MVFGDFTIPKHRIAEILLLIKKILLSSYKALSLLRLGTAFLQHKVMISFSYEIMHQIFHLSMEKQNMLFFLV